MKTPEELMGMRVKELRKKAGLTQEELARLSYLDRSYIVSLENSHRNPTVITISRIAAGMGLRLVDYFDSPLFDELEKQEKKKNEEANSQ